MKKQILKQVKKICLSGTGYNIKMYKVIVNKYVELSDNNFYIFLAD